MKNKRQILAVIILSIIAFSCCRKATNISLSPTSFKGDIWAFQTQNPVLKGLEINPLVKVSVRLPIENSDIKLENLQLQLEGLTNLQDIESIELYASGYNSNIASAKKIATITNITKTLTIPCQYSLNLGENLFWISCKVSSSADIRNTISLKITNAQLSEVGKVAVKEGNINSPKYIGYALRTQNQDNINTYRIPGIATTNKGTLIAVYDNRYENDRDLPANVDVGMSRSTDGGLSWQPMKVIMDMGVGANDGIGDPSILVDKQTGTIWVAALWSHGNKAWNGSGIGLSPNETGQFILVKSEDDGLTWSQPINITSSVKNPTWRLFFQGPGMGISMANGTLVFPAQYRDTDGVPYSTLIYSKDHGNTWEAGTGAKSNTTEAQVVELNDGTLMLNMRDNRGGSRSVSITNDLGKTWVEHISSRSALEEPICMGSIIRVESTNNGGVRNILAFSNPNHTYERKNMTIKLSLDEGKTWQKENQLMIDERLCYGYSCMTMIDKNTIGLIYEGTKELYFVRIPIKDILKD